jgi:hypothetical protein
MLALYFPGVKFVSVIAAIEAAPFDAEVVDCHLQAFALSMLFPSVGANRTCCVVLAVRVFGQADAMSGA